jgi:hypothetical protein
MSCALFATYVTIINMTTSKKNKLNPKLRITFVDYLRRRVKPPESIKLRAEKFARDNRWLGDLRVSVYGMPQGRVWVRITDREGNVLSTETRRMDMLHLLDVCQDQWDITQQLISRLFALEEAQFSTARVLYRDGMPLDTAIEAAKRL